MTYIKIKLSHGKSDGHAVTDVEKGMHVYIIHR